MLFISPDFEQEFACRSFQVVGHVPNTAPAVLLVEFRRALVSNCACQPRRRDAVVGQLSFRIGDQSGSCARPTRGGGDVELIKLIALHQVESDGVARCADDTDAWKGGLEPSLKLESSVARQFRWQDFFVRSRQPSYHSLASRLSSVSSAFLTSIQFSSPVCARPHHSLPRGVSKSFRNSTSDPSDCIAILPRSAVALKPSFTKSQLTRL